MKNPHTMLVIFAGLMLTASAIEPALQKNVRDANNASAEVGRAQAPVAINMVPQAVVLSDGSTHTLSPTASLALREQVLRDLSVPMRLERLEAIGRSVWAGRSEIQRKFLVSRSHVIMDEETRREAVSGKENTALRPFYIELGLAKKKADKTATPEDEAAAAGEGVDPEAEKKDDSVDEMLFGIQKGIFLRNAGVSLSGGYGVVKEDAIGTVIARWNIRQAKATFWYNNLVAEAESLGYKPVPYYGMNRDQFVGWYGRAHGVTNPAELEQQSRLTAWGPFIGGAVAGEKVDSGAGEERPLLAGLSFGFGFSSEAASLFYIDVGATISPERGFKSSKLYVGFSADAELLGAVWGKIRGEK